MKKFYKLLSLIVLLAMVFLALSCSEEAEMPTDPQLNISREIYNLQNKNVDYSINSELIDICLNNNAGYVIPSGEQCPTDFSNYQIANPQYTHFLLYIKEWVDAGYIVFKQDQMANAYSNKIMVLIKMLEGENFTASEKKLINDIYKHTENWIIDDIQRQVIIAFLEITKWMIDNPDIPIYHGIYWKTEEVIQSRPHPSIDDMTQERKCKLTGIGWESSDGTQTDWITIVDCGYWETA